MNKLENYKNEIKKRISLTLFLCILALLTVTIGNFYLRSQFPNKENITNIVIGFFILFELATVGFMGYLARIYNNENLLKEYFLKENDEREILIRMKSGINIVPVLSMLIVIASFVVAYISYEAFVAMQAIALAQIVISFILKVYWNKKI